MAAVHGAKLYPWEIRDQGSDERGNLTYCKLSTLFRKLLP